MMWYGRLATTSYGGATRSDEVLVERVALDEAQAPVARARSANRLAQERRETTVELDRGDLGAGVEQTAGQEPEARDRSRGRGRPGAGAASARIASRTSASARKFCDSAWRARSPAARSVATNGRPASMRARAVERRSPSPASRAAATAGRRGRGPARSPAGEPARAGRADHRPVVGAQRGPRHDERQAAAPSASPASRVRRARVRGDAAAEHDRAGAGRPRRRGSSW